MRHLEAIESDDYKHLPGGIFNRSFVRAFARCVGFDEKRALDLYASTSRDRGVEVDEPLTSPHRSRVYTDGDAGRSPLLTFALSALLVGILCLGIYALWYAYERRFGGVSTGGDAAAQKSAAAQKAGQSAPPQSASTPEAVAAVPDKLQIELRARDKSFWVSWRQDEEKKQRGRIISPGGPESMTLERSLSLKVGRGDVANLEVLVNGQPARLPADAAGTGDVEVLITKDNFRQYLP
jgi:cytoskeletal protein RodZ